MDKNALNESYLKSSDEDEKFALNVRSEEVQEIIGRPPHWLVRWGVSIFLGMLLVLLFLTWFIRYPETIEAPVKLTAINAPKTLNSNINGKLIKLCVPNNVYVKQGQVLAWLESTADHVEILKLTAQIDSMRQWLLEKKFNKFKKVGLKEFSNLGELQPDFQAFEQSWRNFAAFLPNGFYNKKKSMLKKQLKFNKTLNEKLREKKNVQQQNYQLAKQEYTAQKKLAENNMIALLEFAKQKSKWLNSQLPLQQTESSIINNKATRISIEKKIMDLNKEIHAQSSSFLQALNTLKSSIEAWENKHLLIAPFSGRVIYASVLQENQTLYTGQQVFYIKPPNTKFFGEMKVKQASFGKIKKGQKVLVRFKSYPYQEFGSVPTRISYLSSIPLKDSVFLAKLKFPDVLSTRYGNKLTPHNGMEGRAEIITQNKTILGRIYNNLTKTIK